MKWQKKLNKAERKHMREWNGNSIAGLKRNMAARKEKGLGPCHECDRIWSKLGLWVCIDHQSNH
jgi:hypothetical protein